MYTIHLLCLYKFFITKKNCIKKCKKEALLVSRYVISPENNNNNNNNMHIVKILDSVYGCYYLTSR